MTSKGLWVRLGNGQTIFEPDHRVQLDEIQPTDRLEPVHGFGFHACVLRDGRSIGFIPVPFMDHPKATWDLHRAAETSPTLGNLSPTETEKRHMLAVLDGLRERLNEHDSFGPATLNKEGVAELRWTIGGSAWVSAWIGGTSRSLHVWRHPSYRFERDAQYLHDACNKVTP